MKTFEQLSLNEKAALAVTYFEALCSNPNNTKEFAINKLDYTKEEAEVIVKVWCKCYVELTKAYAWDHIVSLASATITEEELSRMEKQKLAQDVKIVKAFLKDWNKELQATKKVQKLSEDLDWAYRMEKPHERIANSLQHWEKVQGQAINTIIEKTKQGIYTQNTLNKLIQLYGNGGDQFGYIIDCFGDMLEVR